MVLAPAAANAGYVTCDGTTVGGVTDAPITDKNTMVEVTAYGDTAVARYPTIDDADFKMTVVYDAADAGQDKIWTSLTNKTKLTYLRYLTATTYYTLSAYVKDVSWSPPVDGVVTADITFAVSGGAALTVPA